MKFKLKRIEKGKWKFESPPAVVAEVIRTSNVHDDANQDAADVALCGTNSTFSSATEDGNSVKHDNCYDTWWIVQGGKAKQVERCNKGKENDLPQVSHHRTITDCPFIGFERKEIPFTDLPDNWLYKEAPRNGGGVNRTFYEPGTRRRFRSLVGALRHINNMKDNAELTEDCRKRNMSGTTTIDQAAAKFLKNNALDVEKRLKASMIDVYDETRARPVQKAEVGHTPMEICSFR